MPNPSRHVRQSPEHIAAWDAFKHALEPLGYRGPSRAALCTEVLVRGQRCTWGRAERPCLRRARSADEAALLRPLFDHRDMLNFAVGRALVAHSYIPGDDPALDGWDRAARLLIRSRVALILLPASASWYYPGGTTVVVAVHGPTAQMFADALAPLGARRLRYLEALQGGRTARRWTGPYAPSPLPEPA